MRILPNSSKQCNVFTPRDPENKPVVFDKSNPRWVEMNQKRARVAVEISNAVTDAQQRPGYQTERSLIEIALEVGYTSPSHFAQGVSRGQLQKLAQTSVLDTSAILELTQRSSALGSDLAECRLTSST